MQLLPVFFCIFIFCSACTQKAELGLNNQIKESKLNKDRMSASTSVDSDSNTFRLNREVIRSYNSSAFKVGQVIRNIVLENRKATFEELKTMNIKFRNNAGKYIDLPIQTFLEDNEK